MCFYLIDLFYAVKAKKKKEKETRVEQKLSMTMFDSRQLSPPVVYS